MKYLIYDRCYDDIEFIKIVNSEDLAKRYIQKLGYGSFVVVDDNINLFQEMYYRAKVEVFKDGNCNIEPIGEEKPLEKYELRAIEIHAPSLYSVSPGVTGVFSPGDKRALSEPRCFIEFFNWPANSVPDAKAMMWANVQEIVKTRFS